MPPLALGHGLGPSFGPASVIGGGGGGGGIDPHAILDEDGNPILDEDGNQILDEG